CRRRVTMATGIGWDGTVSTACSGSVAGAPAEWSAAQAPARPAEPALLLLNRDESRSNSSRTEPQTRLVPHVRNKIRLLDTFPRTSAACSPASVPSYPRCSRPGGKKNTRL
ncbi:hypothetical protein M9458_047404, partial [Cirrhinus mrigala]